MFKNASSLILAASMAFCLVGCENLPGDKGSQGAVIGGAGGATVGAAVGGSEHRLLGALLGGALGAAGGYVVGANSDRILGKDHDSADEAARKSQQMPATSQEALQATTADVNEDGFVTLGRSGRNEGGRFQRRGDASIACAPPTSVRADR